jgi:predicted DNA-binding protein (MmcQ/YjbR family)
MSAPITEREVVDRIRPVCLGLDGAFEKLSHGHTSFATKAGIFAVLEEYKGELSLCVNVGPLMQDLFLEDPRFYRTPYIGKLGWVSLRVHAAPLKSKEIAALLRGSHALVSAGKKTRKLSASSRK